MTIRVVIVDDHPIFRLGLAASLQDMADVQMVGEASSAAEVDDLVAAAQPDVVLLDVHLPDRSGLDVNRGLADDHPEIKVIVLTMSEDHHAALAAIRDGARGYIVKGADPAQIEHALQTVMAGDVVLDRELAHAITELAHLRGAPAPSPFPHLSPRELVVLDLVARGLDNHTIARRLVLNPKTVRNHVSNILAKIGVADRAQAIVLARRSGLGADD